MTSPAERKAARRFPSVFQAWGAADDRPNEDPLVTLARHDLAWVGVERLGMKWEGETWGIGDRLAPETLERGRKTRRRLLSLNPNLILLTEIRYRDAPPSFLPPDHPWWKRDAQGKPEPGWDEGGYLKLDFANPDYRRHVAQRARCVVESGVFDGVMLDWWHDDADRLALVRAVRDAIGPEASIVVNANDRRTPLTAEYINGTFMECTVTDRPEKWRLIADTLMWAETHFRAPQLNCVETWYHTSRDDLHLMRTTTALVLTHSDGYCLFSDPNPLPTPDHLHNWYGFWDKRLGAPRTPSLAASGEKGDVPNGVAVCPQWAASDPLPGDKLQCVFREFEGGTVVYNPMHSETLVIRFPTERVSVATGLVKTDHYLGNPDGDIYLCARCD